MTTRINATSSHILITNSMKKLLLLFTLFNLFGLLFAAESKDYDFYYEIDNQSSKAITVVNCIFDLSTREELWRGEPVEINKGESKKISYNIKELMKEYNNAYLVCDFDSKTPGWAVPLSDWSVNTFTMLKYISSKKIERSDKAIDVFVGNYKFSFKKNKGIFNCENADLVSDISFYKTKNQTIVADNSCEFLESKKLEDGKFEVQMPETDSIDWCYILMLIEGKDGQHCAIHEYEMIDMKDPEIKIDDSRLASKNLKLTFYDERLDKTSITACIYDEKNIKCAFKVSNYEKSYSTLEKKCDLSELNPGKYVFKASCKDFVGNYCFSDYNFTIESQYPDDEKPDCQITVKNTCSGQVRFRLESTADYRNTQVTDEITLQPGESHSFYKTSKNYKNGEQIMVAVISVDDNGNGQKRTVRHEAGTWKNIYKKKETITISDSKPGTKAISFELEKLKLN